jgi:hypothetical protein
MVKERNCVSGRGKSKCKSVELGEKQKLLRTKDRVRLLKEVWQQEETVQRK